MAARDGRGPRQGCAGGSPIAVDAPRLIVAGSSSSIPRAGRACSCYVIDDGEFPIAFDMGTGAFANLRSAADYDRLGAVVISHMHADHFLDIIPLRYALCYGPKRPKRRMPLWLPPGGAATLKRLCSAFADEGGDFLNDVFDVSEYDPSATLRLGSGTLSFAPTSHYIPAFAVRWSNGRASVTYSADTAPDARVSELARGCGLFLCEATLLHDEGEPGVRGHSSAGEAARMARDAGAQHLVLTHYGDRTKPEDLAGAARGVYDGPVAVADDGSVFELVD